MDDPNISIEEYIRLQEEKALSRGGTFHWKTATYGKMEYYENEDDSFKNIKTEYPAIVFDDTSDTALSCEPTVSPLDNNEIDFKISFDESDDEDYMVIFDENSFSCKIISVDNLKIDFEDENDKVNMPSSLSPEPTKAPLPHRAREISHATDTRWYEKHIALAFWEEMAEAGFGAYWSGAVVAGAPGAAEDAPVVDVVRGRFQHPNSNLSRRHYPLLRQSETNVQRGSIGLRRRCASYGRVLWACEEWLRDLLPSSLESPPG
ncbi:hypothetical protein Tco_0588478 [Tanacetum coccineum]